MDDQYWQGVIRKCEQQIEDMLRRIDQDSKGNDDEAKLIWIPFNREYIKLMEAQIERIYNYLRARKEVKVGKKNLP